MSNIVNISGLSHAAVLAALYNASRPQGMGFLHYDAAEMTEAQAAELLTKTKYFDYLKGRVMKLSFNSVDELKVGNYDRDNGQNAAQRVIDELRNSGQTSTPEIQQLHRSGKELAAEIATENMGIESGLRDGVMRLGLAEVKDKLAPKIEAALKNKRLERVTDKGDTICHSSEGKNENHLRT